MTNQQFDDLLKKTIKNYGEDYISVSEECNVPHEFSKSFEKKMDHLIRREKFLFYSPKARSILRKFTAAAASIVVFISSLTLNAVADPNNFASFNMAVYITHTTVTVKNYESAPEFIEEFYEPTYLPGSYHCVNKTRIYDEPVAWMDYRYTDWEDSMHFHQTCKANYNVSVNTEESYIEDVKINGYEGFMCSNLGYCYIAWDIGDYILSLDGGFDEKEMIKIAESVQKVEKDQ